ncbi:hypothetical protein [Colwellia polaris]|uniref:hypothetical protein n=1 Tax=Colwellia polaris TaxID=326537 RepID=UPI000A17126F|nr:hypothetical protein [Colwellia polaris]
MSINKRQFNILQAMGITVWQRRELTNTSSTSSNAVQSKKNSNEIDQASSAPENTSASSVVHSDSNPSQTQQTSISDKVAIDLDVLLKQQLFKDIILSIGASSADISIANDQIDLGIINWQFSENSAIEFKHNCLKTPVLTTLANSPALKKALWQSLGSLSST